MNGRRHYEAISPFCRVSIHQAIKCISRQRRPTCEKFIEPTDFCAHIFSTKSDKLRKCIIRGSSNHKQTVVFALFSTRASCIGWVCARASGERKSWCWMREIIAGCWMLMLTGIQVSIKHLTSTTYGVMGGGNFHFFLPQHQKRRQTLPLPSQAVLSILTMLAKVNLYNFNCLLI